MDQTTIVRLEELNRAFYQTVGESFHASRHLAWQGWRQVLKSIAAQLDVNGKLTMLDLGCGNGRWGDFFLTETDNRQTTYVGVDENQTLLQYAELAILPRAKVLHLHHQDLQSLLLDQEKLLPPPLYDLIVLFGVWHHLPSAVTRAASCVKLAARLQPGGILVISCWRFLRSPRLAVRILDPNIVGLDASQLEVGDYLLDWRAETTAIRYCHDTTKEELVTQATAAGLKLIDDFTADGKTGNLNDYYLLMHNSPHTHLHEEL